MPKFSKLSEERLSTCDSRLQLILKEAIELIDFTVLEGHRGKEAQDEAFRKGTSQLPWPKGKHNALPSRAVDIAPYPIDWNDTHRFAFLMGLVAGIAKKHNVKVRFGLDWNRNGKINDEKFKDFPHVELDEP